MNDKAYIIPRGSWLFTVAAVCMSVQFAALTLVNCLSLDNHIPFFGNIINTYTHGFFAIMFIEDILYFFSCVLQVIGVFLARRNLWILSAGWICTLLLQLFEYFAVGGSGTISFNFAACAALVLILVQIGSIRSRKAAIIPFIAGGIVYLAATLPTVLVYRDAILALLLLCVLQYVSCALLMGSMLFKTDAVTLPKPIVEVNSGEER